MELHLPSIQEVEKKNPVNGRFLKGHKPFNKGKKQEEWLTKEQVERNKEILRKFRQGRKDIGGWNKKAVAIIKDGKLLKIVESSVKASEITGVIATNIRKVCRKERKHSKGYLFFYTDDIELLKYI